MVLGGFRSFHVLVTMRTCVLGALLRTHISQQSNSLSTANVWESVSTISGLKWYTFSLVYAAISRKVVRQSAHDNPERYCG